MLGQLRLYQFLFAWDKFVYVSSGAAKSPPASDNLIHSTSFLSPNSSLSSFHLFCFYSFISHSAISSSLQPPVSPAHLFLPQACPYRLFLPFSVPLRLFPAVHFSKPPAFTSFIGLFLPFSLFSQFVPFLIFLSLNCHILNTFLLYVTCFCLVRVFIFFTFLPPPFSGCSFPCISLS